MPLAARLATIGSDFHGWAGLWTHDLSTGITAGWNSDARFPAASTVKLGVLHAALDRSVHASGALAAVVRPAADRSLVVEPRREPPRDPPRLLRGRRGTAPARDDVEHLSGRLSSGHGAGVDAPKPPPHGHTRVTTARDLGRALYRLQAAALGNRTALRADGADAASGEARPLAPARPRAPRRATSACCGPWLGSAHVVEKNGWLSDTRITAAIVYRPARGDDRRRRGLPPGPPAATRRRRSAGASSGQSRLR